MVMICPYCDIEINEKLVEAEDGCCPECGALITASTVINEDEDEFYDGDDAELGEDDELGDDYGYSDAGASDDEFKDEDY